MNWGIVEGKWEQVKGQLKSQWAKLTDDDLRNLSAKKDQLVGKIQERYGIMKDEAERQVDQWLQGMDEPRGRGEKSGARGEKSGQKSPTAGRDIR